MAAPQPDSYNVASGQDIYVGRVKGSEYWEGLAQGWTQIYNGNGSTQGTDSPPGGISAFSGQAVDDARGKLHLFGGGHNDYYGNEVWTFDLDPVVFSWSKNHEPDIGPDPNPDFILSIVDHENYAGGYTHTQRPYGRHTHYSVHWIDSLDRMIASGSSSYSGSGEWMWENNTYHHMTPKDLWLYDPNTVTWEWKGSEVCTPGFLYSASTAYDSVGDKLYGIIPNLSGSWIVNEYDPATNNWTEHNVAGGGVYGGFAPIFDINRNRIAAFGQTYPFTDKLWTYDVTNKLWADISPASGSPPAGGNYGFAHDLHNDVYLASNDGTMWVFDPNAGVWTQGASGPTLVQQVNGSLTYDRLRKVTFLTFRKSSSGPIDVWAYKV